MDTQKIFDDTIKQIESQFGKGSIISFDTNLKPTEIIPSGSLQLDRALGIGGYPKGRIIEIYGNESSGKTTLALQAVAQCQKNNGKCAYIDVEHALDAKYCASNGIDLGKMILAQPDSGEQSFSIIEALIKTGMIDLIVVDSVAGLVPEAEINNNFEQQTMGLHARLMSKGLRILQGYIAKYNVTVIFINQIREKIGILFGDNKTTTGGWALKFFSSIRIELKRSEIIKKGTACVGIRSQARIIKNKLAPPLTTAFIDIYFDRGFDYTNEVIDIAVEKNIISKRGSWYFYKEIKLAQGKDGMQDFLKDHNNLTIYEEIKNKVIEISPDIKTKDDK